MKRFINIFFLLLVLIFFLSTYRFYSSKNNIEAKNFNRNNINNIINTKISNLPTLRNDTNNVIEFKYCLYKEVAKLLSKLYRFPK